MRPLRTLAVSQTAAVNGPRLPCSCLLDVTFSPPCLGAIQVTLPEGRIDRFLILCNTAEPEMNYRDLSTEHLPAFPHMLSLTAQFYPLPCFTFHCHLLFFHYLSCLYFIQYFISAILLSFPSGQWGRGRRRGVGGALIPVLPIHSLSSASLLSLIFSTAFPSSHFFLTPSSFQKAKDE